MGESKCAQSAYLDCGRRGYIIPSSASSKSFSKFSTTKKENKQACNTKLHTHTHTCNLHTQLVVLFTDYVKHYDYK